MPAKATRADLFRAHQQRIQVLWDEHRAESDTMRECLARRIDQKEKETHEKSNRLYAEYKAILKEHGLLLPCEGVVA